MLGHSRVVGALFVNATYLCAALRVTVWFRLGCHSDLNKKREIVVMYVYVLY